MKAFTAFSTPCSVSRICTQRMSNKFVHVEFKSTCLGVKPAGEVEATISFEHGLSILDLAFLTSLTTCHSIVNLA